MVSASLTKAWTINRINMLRPTLPEGHHAISNWWNYFDPDDALGWPLKPLSAGYREEPGQPGQSYGDAVIEDISINASGGSLRGWLQSWSALSHSGYLLDGEFLGDMTDKIQAL